MYVPVDHPDGGFDVKTRVSNRDISYLLTCALECGNVNYWCVIVDLVKPKDPTVWMERDDDGKLRNPKEKPHRYYDWPLSEGGALVIAELDEWSEAEEEGDTSKVKTYRVDRESIQRALNRMQAEYPHHFANFMKDNADAITGDVFLQLCCGFEEGVRYG
jgi:hypothetical protein